MNELTCEQVRDQIAECIYGESTEAVERHLATCFACRNTLTATRRALAAVDRAGLATAPDGIAEAVVAGVAVGLVQPRPRLRLLTSLAAGVALAAAGAWFLVRAPGSVSPGANEVLAVEAAAVAADAEGVIQMIDDLERENDALLRLLSQGEGEEPSRS